MLIHHFDFYSSSTKHTVKFSFRPLSPAVWLSYTLFSESKKQIRIIYSVRITKHSFRHHQKESIMLPDISPSKSSANQIFKLLVKGRVTPYAADEVMESILG